MRPAHPASASWTRDRLLRRQRRSTAMKIAIATRKTIRRSVRRPLIVRPASSWGARRGDQAALPHGGHDRFFGSPVAFGGPVPGVAIVGRLRLMRLQWAGEVDKRDAEGVGDVGQGGVGATEVEVRGVA